MGNIRYRVGVCGASVLLLAVLAVGAPSVASASPPLDSCAAKSEESVVLRYQRGPAAIPLRCGTIKWGFRHVVGHGRWNERFDAKVAWTISRGQEFGAGTIYAAFDSNCLEVFRVVVNPGPIYGTGFRPQGIITAYETTGWPTSVAWTDGGSEQVPRVDCMLFDKVRMFA